MSDVGWIKTYRKIQECWIWLDKEPFDKRSAWIDLLLTANHSDKKILFNGELITVKRGQILTSVRKLGEKWRWSNDKVLRFLKLTESDGMIRKESDNFRTLITIENYEVYQETTNTDRTPTSTGTSTGTSHKQEYKECKELNNNRISKDILCQTQDVRRVVDEWNSLSSYGIKPVSKLSSGSKRYGSLVARLNEYSVDDVIKAIDNIRHSDFLQGRHGGRQWQVTFDWFVLPNNFPKVLEGNYNSSENIQNEDGGGDDRWE